MLIRRGGAGTPALGMAVELRNLLVRHRYNIDGKDTTRSKRQEEASRLVMRSQRASGSFVATQFTGRGCITVLGLCLGVSCFVHGGLVAVAQGTDSPVASIESLVRSEQYDQALQLTKSQLHRSEERRVGKECRS